MIRPVVGASYFIGVDDNQINDPITVYPIPAISTLHIGGVNHGNSIAMYDITGRKVLEEAFTEELSIRHLPNGLYLMNIITAEGKVISKKIMVNR